MGPAITLPKLVFGSGALAALPAELALLGVARPFLISDHGLERAGLVARVPAMAAVFLDVPENPVAAGVNAAAAAYRAAGCDGVVALGGGSVLDTAKMVVALAVTDRAALDLIGHYDRIAAVAPLVAIPPTVGTGSDGSPVAAIHREAHHGTLIGVALPHATKLLAREMPAQAARIAAAIGDGTTAAGLGAAVAALIARLGLPTTMTAAGSSAPSLEAMLASPFNRFGPYAPTADEYRAIAAAIA